MTATALSRPDLYVTSLMDFHRGWRQRADELSETTELFTLLGTYIARHHGGRYYGKAMNLTRRLPPPMIRSSASTTCY